MATPEELRHEIATYFYERRGVSQDAATIARGLKRAGIQCTVEAVDLEGDFLVELGWLATDNDPLGSTKYFHITGKGTLEYERSNQR